MKIYINGKYIGKVNNDSTGFNYIYNESGQVIGIRYGFRNKTIDIINKDVRIEETRNVYGETCLNYIPRDTKKVRKWTVD